jgi:uncharacterized membrane protein HdeD (DUF308 family)
MGVFKKIIFFLFRIILNIISYLARKVWDEVLRLLIWGAILILIYLFVYKYLLN